MKNLIIITLLGFGILGFGILVAAQAVPNFINYQGVLRDAAGTLQTGNFTLTFKIYDAVTGGNLKYDSGGTTVTVNTGIYNALIGPVDSTTVFNGDNRWLEVSVGTDVLAPRMKINSVAYAITAGTVTTAEYANNLANYTIGTGSGNIPVSSGTVCTNLNAEKTNGYKIYAGTGQIDLGASIGTVTINDANKLSDSSKILITPGLTSSTVEAIRIYEINAPNNFKVRTASDKTTATALPFNYLIIN